MKRTVLVVSDLHCGHTVGLWHPDVKMPDSSSRNLNAGQRYLWTCWQDLIQEAKRQKVDVLVINGDIVDGEQRINMGREALSTIIPVQQRCAVKLLEPLANIAKEVRCISGTPFHDGRLGEYVEAIASEIGAVGPNSDWHCYEYLDLDIDGVVINFLHGIPATGALYRAVPIDREALWSAIAGKEGNVPKADCIVRSHVHYFVHVEHVSKHGVISPAWQLQTPYMRKASMYRMLPNIGALFIEVDGAAKRRGEDPITVRKKIYPLPAVKATASKLTV